MNISADAVILGNNGDHFSEKYQRIAEVIRDYNPELELAWIPPSDRTAFDKEPFAIFHNSAQFGRYLIGTFREDQMDHRIISHLFKIDNKNRNVLSDLEADEAARQLLEMKKKLDDQEERHDFVRSVVTSKKHYYKHNGRKWH